MESVKEERLSLSPTQAKDILARKGVNVILVYCFYA